MPFQMRRALECRGLEVVCCSAPPARSRARMVPAPLGQRAPWALRLAWRTARGRIDGAMERLQSRRRERERLHAAAHRAALLCERIRAVEPDVIFGCCISSMLFGLETDVPIVYFSDATARIINETYPAYIRRGAGYKRVCDAYEHATMQRVHLAGFATELARQSAIRDYGLDHRRSRVVPMGASITAAQLPAWRQNDAQPPVRGDLQLCLVASDPARKRADLAVAVVERLARRGWNARLNHIGQINASLRRSPLVRSSGPRRLSSPQDRARIAETMARSHLMILPSVGEAFGIAPCEASQFGRPSVVSAAGGLREVVVDGETGLVLPLSAAAEEYADAIEALADDPQRYRAMSAAAMSRARTRLNWSAWAAEMAPMLAHAAAGRVTGPRERRIAPVLVEPRKPELARF